MASVCGMLALYVFIKEMKELLYFSVKVFFHSILSIFFRDVEIVGIQNVPSFGPCIFSINHANQFIDSVMLVCTCQRTVSYLMAEASYRRRVVGDIAWAMGVVPVKRPQDSALKGTGQITIARDPQNEELFLATGQDTTFIAQLQVGDKIRPPGTSIALKVKEIVNDTSLVLDGSGFSDTFEPFDSPKSFDILKRIDQKQVYEKVLERIANGGAIGMYTQLVK